MDYTPHPAATEGISLSEDVLLLGEQLARNTHEVWAKRRMADGWVFGARRDDACRTHPCLVPYEQLGEEEKEYDRATAMETLRLIVSLGYRIERREDGRKESLP